MPRINGNKLACGQLLVHILLSGINFSTIKARLKLQNLIYININSINSMRFRNRTQESHLAGAFFYYMRSKWKTQSTIYSAFHS